MASKALVPLPGVYHSEHHGGKAGKFWYRKAKTCPKCSIDLARKKSGIYQCPTCGLIDYYEPTKCPECGAFMGYDEREVHSCPICGIVDPFKPRLRTRSSKVAEWRRIRALRKTNNHSLLGDS